MKKIILILIILAIPILSSAQPVKSAIGTNSTVTALDSSAKFTGKWEPIPANCIGMFISINSNKSSATSGLRVEFSYDKASLNQYFLRTYTTGDTTATDFPIPIRGLYVRVKYTNTNAAQTTFSLITYFTKSETNLIDANGNLSFIASGGATSEDQLVMLGYLHPANKFPTSAVFRDTVTTGTDSLTFSTYFSSAPTVWASMSVRNVSTDGTILQISLNSNFAGSRLVHPQGVDGFSFFSPVTFTKIYIKKYSGTNGWYEQTGEAY